MTEPTPNTGGPSPDPIPARRHRRRLALVLIVALLACAALAGFAAWPRRSPGPPEPAADESLYPRLLQAVVHIAPEGGKGGGCGVLIDTECRLVVTVADVMAGADNARVYFPTGSQGQDARAGFGSVRASEEAGIVAHLVHRDENRKIDLLHLQQLPARALALSLGERLPGPGQALYTLRRPEPNLPATNVGAWSYRRGALERVVMPPHY
jgi:hypothetical protein